MKKLLYIIRAEADFERVVCLAIAGRKRSKQEFIFVGDISLFFEQGIRNIFQKALFQSGGFSATNLHEFSLTGRILSKLISNPLVTLQDVRREKRMFFNWVFLRLLQRYVLHYKQRLINKALNYHRPDILLTDQSMTDAMYLPEMFRRAAIEREIPVFLYTHGAAGGLHSFFSEQNFQKYEGCTVFACSRYENKAGEDNRIILGDMSSGYPYVKFLHNKDINNIDFRNDSKYRIGFFVGGTGPFTSTTGWHTMEEIIIDHSENPDVAMVLKMHPREAPFLDLRMLRRFNNLHIVGRETDRSRVTKWANIVVCSDHCSTVFEPMVLGKGVVAFEGRHIPRYKHSHSPLKDSSVQYIMSADEFIVDDISQADPEDSVTNIVAWGGRGKLDLAQLAHDIIAMG